MIEPNAQTNHPNSRSTAASRPWTKSRVLGVADPAMDKVLTKARGALVRELLKCISAIERSPRSERPRGRSRTAGEKSKPARLLTSNDHRDGRRVAVNALIGIPQRAAAAGNPPAPAQGHRWDALRVAAIGGEVAILAATATVAGASSPISATFASPPDYRRSDRIGANQAPLSHAGWKREARLFRRHERHRAGVVHHPRHSRNPGLGSGRPVGGEIGQKRQSRKPTLPRFAPHSTPPRPTQPDATRNASNSPPRSQPRKSTPKRSDAKP